MSAESWIDGACHSMFPNVNAALKRGAGHLVASFAPDDEYAAEKLIKSFVEPIMTLEALLREREGLDSRHLTQLLAARGGVQQAHAKAQSLEQRLLSEVQRQQRHFLAFLGHAQTRGRQADHS